MEYYQPHSTDLLSHQFGTITRKLNEYYVNDILVTNNRAISGDIVYLKNNEVVGIKQRNHQLIVGILHLNTNQKYGLTKRNVPYYKFTSISNKFQNFIVPSKSREKKALYCVIKINKWETQNKHPIGQIEQLLGEVGNIDNEINMLLYHTQIYPKKNRTKYLESSDLSKNKVDYHTYSVDPSGCKDIDDALHFQQLDGKVEIGIHIANVARCIDQLDTNYFSTIYLKNKQLNMLDDNLTYNLCSLGNGKPKKALSLILTYQDNQLIDSQFKETIVINKAMSYQQVDKIISKQIDHPLLQLYQFTKKIKQVEEIKATKLIEHYMLLYNNLLAEQLYHYNPNTILRTHQLSDSKYKASDNDEQLQSYLTRISQQAALYLSNPSETYHQDLELKYYTHATSPIRRYVDIINQFNMINKLEKRPLQLEDKLDQINQFQKKLRKFYNYYKKLNIIFDNNFDDEYDAYIIGVSQLKVKIFIPQLDIEHGFLILSPKLVEANDVTIEEDQISINQVDFSVYDKIKIKLTSLPYEEKFNKKLHVKILEPSFKIY